MSKTKLAIILELSILGVVVFLFIKEIISNKISEKVNNQINKVEYSAWIPSWDEKRSTESIINGGAGGKMGTILPVWYLLDSSGQIKEINSDNKSLITETARQNNIKIIPTIANSNASGFDPISVTNLLNGDQNKTIQIFTDLAINNKYNGWDLDLEEISENDKDKYSSFVKNLAESLHNNKLTLSITVHSQDGTRDWKGALGQDIETLGKYADEIRVMAYDFHNSDSEQGPITPIIDLEKSIIYIKSKVDLKKIVISLPTYGYDWQKNGKGVSYQYMEMVDHLKLKGIKANRDIDSRELNASYENHRVWYLDSESLLKLVQITKGHGITKICFWHLGGEDLTLWEKI